MLVVWRSIHFSFEIVHISIYWAIRAIGIDGEKGREGREHEGFKEDGSRILHNGKTALSGVKLNPKQLWGGSAENERDRPVSGQKWKTEPQCETGQ